MELVGAGIRLCSWPVTSDFKKHDFYGLYSLIKGLEVIVSETGCSRCWSIFDISDIDHNILERCRKKFLDFYTPLTPPAGTFEPIASASSK